jgi:hypothetical protein
VRVLRVVDAEQLPDDARRGLVADRARLLHVARHVRRVHQVAALRREEVPLTREQRADLVNRRAQLDRRVEVQHVGLRPEVDTH